MALIFGAIGFLLGAALGAEISAPFIEIWDWSSLVWWWLCWLLGLALVAWMWRHQLLTCTVIFASLAICGFARASQVRANFAQIQISTGQEVTIEGRISDFPRLLGRTQRLTLKTTAFGRPIGILVETGREPIFERDSLIRVTGRLTRPRPSIDFDYPRYLEGQGIIGLLVRPDQIDPIGPPRPIWAWLNQLRSQITTSLEQALPEPAASLALGLTLGIPPTIDPDLTAALVRTNLTHLAAVSGQNLSLTVIVIFQLLRRLWLRAAIATTLLLLGIYLGLVGAEPSVTRAATMVTFLVCAPLVGRPVEPLRLLLATAAVMAATNPLIITRDVGFQLSFAAFAGILLLGPVLARALTKLPDWLAETVSTILAATLAVLPVQLIIFGSISFVGPLANFLVGFIVSFAMGASFVLAVFSLISVSLTQLLAPIIYFPLAYLEKVALGLSHWSLANREFVLQPMVSWGLVVAESIGFVALSRLLRRYPWLHPATMVDEEKL